MTLLDALSIIRRAYEEDETEREAILDALWPVLLGDKMLVTSAVMTAWPTAGDAIREIVAEYQSRRQEMGPITDAQLRDLLDDEDPHVRHSASCALFAADAAERQKERARCAEVLAGRASSRPS